MCVPYRQRDPHTRFLMIFGTLALVAALLLWAFVRSSSTLAHSLAPHSWIDALSGLLFGLSIGANLTAIMRTRRCRPVEAQNP